MPNGTYGGVRGRKTKVGRKLLRFPPTQLFTNPPNEAGNRESNEYTLANCLIKSIVEAVGCNTFAFCTLVVFLEVEIFFIG